MKAVKAAGYDRVSLEMLRAGEEVVADLLYTLFNLCWELKRVPGDWCKAVIVPLYKGKGSQQACKNYRGISLLSIVGKLYKVKVTAYIRPTAGHRPPLISERVLGQGNVRRAAPMRVGELHMSSKYIFFDFSDTQVSSRCFPSPSSTW